MKSLCVKGPLLALAEAKKFFKSGKWQMGTATSPLAHWLVNNQWAKHLADDPGLYTLVYDETASIDEVNDVLEVFNELGTKGPSLLASPDSNVINLISNYVFCGKWQESYGPTKIKGRNGFKVGGHLLDSNSQLTSVRTEGGTILFFWYTKTKGFDLFEEAIDLCLTDFDPTPARISLPNVEFEDSSSYQLVGMCGSKKEVEVRSLIYDNRLILDQEGVRVTSVSKGQVRTKCSKPRLVEVVYDKKFAVAVFEPGYSFPSFVAKVGKKFWL